MFLWLCSWSGICSSLVNYLLSTYNCTCLGQGRSRPGQCHPDWCCRRDWSRKTQTETVWHIQSSPPGWEGRQRSSWHLAASRCSPWWRPPSRRPCWSPRCRSWCWGRGCPSPACWCPAHTTCHVSRVTCPHLEAHDHWAVLPLAPHSHGQVNGTAYPNRHQHKPSIRYWYLIYSLKIKTAYYHIDFSIAFAAEKMYPTPCIEAHLEYSFISPRRLTFFLNSQCFMARTQVLMTNNVKTILLCNYVLV